MTKLKGIHLNSYFTFIVEFVVILFTLIYLKSSQGEQKSIMNKLPLPSKICSLSYDV